MVVELDTQTQLQIAAVTFPIIALVVSFAIESIEDEGWRYRAVVGCFGIISLVPGLIVMILAVLGGLFGFTAQTIPIYLVISFSGVTILVISVLLHEIFKGLEEQSQIQKLLVSLALTVTFIFISLYFIQ